MAVTHQASATGSKTTAGTSFTIALSSTAGDCVLVAIGIAGTTVTVSSITDGGSNTYHQVGAVNNTNRCELWKTDKATPAASGTLTVNLSASGAVVNGVAESYRGVAYGGEAVATNTGTSTTPTSGSRTLRETLGTGVVITGCAKNNANALSSSSGTVRGNVGTSLPRTALMDSEGNTSPVTNTATGTGSVAWAAVSVELRPLQVTDNDGANWSDTKLAGYGNSIPDVMELLDADSTNQLAGKQNIDYNGWAHWMEDFRVFVGDTIIIGNIGGEHRLALNDGNERTKVLSVSGNPSVTITETLVWQDGTPSKTLQLGLGIICPHLGDNWLDALLSLLGLAETVSDTLTMSDSLRIGYGAITSDQLVIADSLSSGYGGQLSDQIVFSDGAPSMTGDWMLDVICPHLGDNWLDAVIDQLSGGGGGLTLTLTDNDGANWSDLLRAGYGNLTSDQIVFVDSLGAGYSGSLSDSMSISDSLAVGYGNSLSDSLNSWLDSESAILGMIEVISDNLNNWLDFLVAGYGAQTSDQIVIVDSLGAGYGGSLSDQLVLTDFQALGYGNVVSDSLNNWLDSELNVLGLIETLSDSLTSWLDALGIGYGNTISDQMSLTDSLNAGYGSATSDQLVFVDSLGAGYSAGLSDQIIFSDFTGLGYGFSITDNLNNWTDLLAKLLGAGLSVSDTMTMSDFLAVGYGAATSDQIIIVESIGAGYGAVLSDNDNFWQDKLDIFTNQPGIQLTLSDDEGANWLDRLGAGYGSVSSDQIVIVDSLGAGYGAILSDNDIFWLDSDVLVVGFVKTIADNLNAWADFVAAGYGNATSDQLVIVDSLGAGYGALISDSLNNWLDSVIDSLVGNNIDVILSDSLNNWLDALRIGYGAITSDQLVIADSLGAGYGAVLSDNSNLWLDSIQLVGQSLISLIDNLNFWLDSLATRQDTALVLSDSLSFTDVLGLGYGLLPSEQMLPADSLLGGVGLSIFDDGSATWGDFFTNTGLFPFTFSLSDSIAFWDDGISEFRATNTAPAKYRLARIDQRVVPSYLLVVNQMAYRLIKLFKDPLQITGYGTDSSDSSANQWFDQVNIAAIAAPDLGLFLGDDISSLWNDRVASDNAFSGAFGFALGDTLSVGDDLGIGHGWRISDNLAMTDAVMAIDPDTTLILGLSDVITPSDTFTIQQNWRLLLGDSLTVTDSVTASLVSAQLTLLLGDNLTWTDGTAKLFDYRKAVSDGINNLSDGVSHSLAAPFYKMQFSESLNNWLDFVPSFIQEYGASIGENSSSNWNDAVTKTLS